MENPTANASQQPSPRRGEPEKGRELEEDTALTALVCASRYGLTDVTELYRRAGSATAIMEHRHDIRAIYPEATERVVKAIAELDTFVPKAEEEYTFCRKYSIQPIAIDSPNYPSRLRECPDAPLLLFMRGNADLNSRRIISIVGTRHCTAYGHDLIERFMADLKELCPQALIVSGLAYGVDICAHNAALDGGFPTLGVLAHGLDTLYPPSHKPTARRMVEQGGLLTEYATHTKADKLNFVRRNRIVAGMADATVLVESAVHGGGLITTRLAAQYHHNVFAFPGPVGARYSEGCNNLIRDGGAQLITCAADLINRMGWTADAQLAQAKQQGIERQLFPTLSPDEQRVADLLSADNDLQANIIATRTGLSIPKLSTLLFSLEMQGIVRLYPGGIYHLLM